MRSSTQPATPPTLRAAPEGACVGGGVAVAQGVCGTCGGVGAHQSTLPEARADRFLERSGRDEVALVVDGDLQLRQRALGRAEDHLGVLRHVEGRLVARAEQVVRLLLVQADRAADVGADLGVGDDAVVAPVLLLLGLDVLLVEAHEQHGRLGLLLEEVRGAALTGDRVGQQALRHDVEDRADGDVLGLDRGVLGVAHEPQRHERGVLAGAAGAAVPEGLRQAVLRHRAERPGDLEHERHREQAERAAEGVLDHRAAGDLRAGPAPSHLVDDPVTGLVGGAQRCAAPRRSPRRA